MIKILYTRIYVHRVIRISEFNPFPPLDVPYTAYVLLANAKGMQKWPQDPSVCSQKNMLHAIAVGSENKTISLLSDLLKTKN